MASQREPKGSRPGSVASVARTLHEFPSQVVSAPTRGLRFHRGIILQVKKTRSSHNYAILIRTCLSEEAGK